MVLALPIRPSDNNAAFDDTQVINQQYQLPEFR
jgi:hypothetical protein